jgi:hypothetical protein
VEEVSVLNLLASRWEPWGIEAQLVPIERQIKDDAAYLTSFMVILVSSRTRFRVVVEEK